MLYRFTYTDKDKLWTIRITFTKWSEGKMVSCTTLHFNGKNFHLHIIHNHMQSVWNTSIRKANSNRAGRSYGNTIKDKQNMPGIISRIIRISKYKEQFQINWENSWQTLLHCSIIYLCLYTYIIHFIISYVIDL